MARIGVWAAVAAGPLALAVAVTVPRTVVAAPTPKTATTTTPRSADPAGVAALFVDLWLRTDAAKPDSATAQAVRTLAPNVELPMRSNAVPAVVLRTVAVRSALLRSGGWSVVVAAQFTVGDGTADSGKVTGRTPVASAGTVVRYFAVPVLASDAAGPGAFTVTSAPAEVTGPATPKVPASAFRSPLAAGTPVVASVGEFLSAYLAGVGEVDRYLSPGTQLPAVRGTGYRSVVVDHAAADTDRAAGATVPGDGTRVRLQAHVTAKDAADGQWPLVYTLAMTARDGRWEVTALEAGAAPADSSHGRGPNPAPSASNSNSTATKGASR